MVEFSYAHLANISQELVSRHFFASAMAQTLAYSSSFVSCYVSQKNSGVMLG
jgi:predicted transcriptional regulator